MKFLSSRYYFKLIAFILFVSIVPVAFIGLFSYYNSAKMIQNKVNEGNSQILAQTQISVEQPLRLAEKSMLQFLISENMAATIDSLRIPMDYTRVTSIVNGLNGISYGDIKLEDVMMVSLDKGIAISNHEFYYLRQYPELFEFQKISADSRFSFWKKWTGPLIRDSAATGQNLAGVAFIRKLLPVNASVTPPFIIAKISGVEISKYINASKLGEILILDSDMNVVASRDASMIGKDVSQSAYGLKIAGNSEDKSGRLTVSMDGNQSEVSFIRSDYNGWIYVSVTPEALITRDARGIGFATLLTCACLMALVVLMTFLGTQRIYSPIHKLYEAVSENTPGNARGKDEIKYLDDKIHHLVNSQLRMTSELKSQSEQMREFYLSEIFLRTMKEEEIQDKLGKIGYEKAWGYMGVLILEIDTFENTEFHENDRELVEFAINNLICELIPESARWEPVMVRNTCVMLMGSRYELDETFSNYISAQAHMIQHAIKEYLNLKTSIGISRPFNHLTGIHGGYLEAVDSLKHKLLMGDEAIIDIEGVKNRRSTGTGHIAELEQELLYAVKVAETGKVDVLLTGLISEIFHSNPSYVEFQASLGMLLMDLIRIVQEMEVPVGDILGDNEYLFEKIIGFRSQEEVEQWFRSALINPMMALSAQRKKSQNARISGDIIQMIHAQYDKELSLELCAERLNYNAKHVSRVFKQETGISFSEYLAQYRIDMARKFLSETNMKISDISERLQYQNPQNFIRSFRKIEGMTPGQYRERIEKDRSV